MNVETYGFYPIIFYDTFTELTGVLPHIGVELIKCLFPYFGTAIFVKLTFKLDLRSTRRFIDIDAFDILQSKHHSIRLIECMYSF